MKKWMSLPLGMVLAGSAFAGGTQLLWDNYLTPPDGYDGQNALSSDRNTQTQDSWVADDAVFGQIVRVDEIRWVGYREINGGGQYPAADVTVLDSTFNTLLEFNDASYTDSVLDTVQILGRTYQIYEGSVSLETFAGDREFDPGQYYFGTRLVGNTLGQNFFATTGNGTLNGQTIGFTRSPSFFQNNWTPVSQVYGIEFNTDFAFQVRGVIVPEPAAIAMLGAGALLFVRRR